MRSLGLKASVATAVLLTALGALPVAVAQDAGSNGAPAPAPKSLLPAGAFSAPPAELNAEPEPGPPSIPLRGEGEESAPGELSGAGAEAPPVIDMPPPPPLMAHSAQVGLHGPETGGFGPNLWAGSQGAFVKDLMRRTPAPTASRFGHVLLRRALLSITPTPQGALPANFVAERAHLLLRMGEAEGARTLVSQVPLNSYTRRLFEVAPHAHMASGDVAGLCPLVQTGITISGDPLWPLASAVCAALQGDDAGASLILDRERENRTAKAFDILLADRLSVALAGGERGVNVSWPGDAKLTTYRLSMALAGGVEVPRPLLSGANSAVKGWLVRKAQVPLAARLEAARIAAANGAIPAQELINLWSLQAVNLDETAIRSLPVGQLRAAYTAPTYNARLRAMSSLWGSAQSDHDKVALQLVTSRAAAGFPVEKRWLGAGPDLVRSMLLAGDVKGALKWYELARREAKARNPKAGEPLMAIWPLALTADAMGRVPHSAGLFELWADMLDGSGSEQERLQQLLGASVAGLGLINANDLPSDATVEFVNNGYTKRLRLAAQAGRRGEVIMLSALGLGQDAKTVSPSYVYEIVAALRKVGLRREAGLIAAELLIRNGA